MNKLIIKNYLKYIFILIIIIIALLSGKKTPKVESGGNPLKALGVQNKTNPEIGKDQSEYWVNDFISSRKNDYYRVTLKWKSSHDSDVSIFLTSKLDNRQKVFSENLKKSEDYIFKEILFKADDLYENLVFKKDDKKDSSKIFIKDIQVSRLNVNSEAELKQLKPTVFGNTKIIESEARQTKKWGSYFSQLQKDETRLGQIFKSEDDLLSGASFIIKRGGSGLNKYRLELREVSQKDGGISLSSDVLAYKDFTTDEIANYTDDSGVTTFPLVSSLKKGQLYFIGIDNSLADNRSSYIELNGTLNKDAYQSGNAVIQHETETNDMGDLFFAIHTPIFDQINKEKILTDARIEDLGESGWLYEYQSKGDFTDLLDLSYYDRKNIGFNDYEGIVSGSPKDDASYVYKIYTPYSISQARIIAEQMYAGWYRTIISYSFDNQKWIDLPYTGKGKEDSVQKFDSVITGDGNENYLYVKITYDKFDNKEIKLFGLRNFKVVEEFSSIWKQL